MLQKELLETTANTVEPLEIVLNSDESIEKAKDLVEAKYGHVDALINNAGETTDIDYLRGKLSLRECYTKAYDTNVVSQDHFMNHTCTERLSTRMRSGR